MYFHAHRLDTTSVWGFISATRHNMTIRKDVYLMMIRGRSVCAIILSGGSSEYTRDTEIQKKF